MEEEVYCYPTLAHGLVYSEEEKQASNKPCIGGRIVNRDRPGLQQLYYASCYKQLFSGSELGGGELQKVKKVDHFV